MEQETPQQNHIVDMTTDLQNVRSELKNVLIDIKERNTSLKRANTIIYCCSNITRAIATEICLVKM